MIKYKEFMKYADIKHKEIGIGKAADKDQGGSKDEVTRSRLLCEWLFLLVISYSDKVFWS